MNVIVASFNSTGFLYPALAVARELAQRGHRVRLATGSEARPMLDAVHCEPLFQRSSDQAFDVSLWSAPEAIALQERLITRGMKNIACDALVAHPLMIGAALASDGADVPLAQLGGAIALWRPGSWLFSSLADRYARARAMQGLPACSDRDRYWMGHAHLVRGVPELEPDLATLPPGIAHIGQCTIEPQADTSELLEWLERAQRDARAIVFAQLGRSFGSTSAMRAVAEACASEELALLVATERSDEACSDLPGNCFTAPYISPAIALPRCGAVIVGGHPSSVIAALVHGVPLVLLPSGSGTVEVANACASAGAGIVVPEDARSSTEIRAVLRSALADHALHEHARALSAAFARYDGPALSCDLIEHIASAR